MELRKKQFRRLTPIKDSKSITDKINDNQKYLDRKEERENENKYLHWKLSLLDYSETQDLVSQFQFAPSKDLQSIINSNQSDFNSTNYVDNSSIMEFYEKYHKINEYIHKGRLNKITPSFSFIQGIKDNKIVPNPCGLIKRTGKLASIALNDMRVGNKYLNSLSRSLQISDHLEELHLANNRLSDIAIAQMINTLIVNIQMKFRLNLIDLSYNNLGAISVNKLVEFISLKGCSLTRLILEGNLLGDKKVSLLLQAIDNNLSERIHALNLAKNSITDEVMDQLAEVSLNCSYLKYLNLHGNKIKNKGAASLINKLKEHSDIKVLDLGWNLIGDDFQLLPTKDQLITQHQNLLIEKEKKINLNKSVSQRDVKPDDKEKDKNKGKNNKNQDSDPLAKIRDLYLNAELTEMRNNLTSKGMLNTKIDRTKITPFAAELGDFFTQSSNSLLHLDISHNNINYYDSLHLQTEVINNHSILGIHVEGNQMSIDDLGFIKATVKDSVSENYFAYSQISYGINDKLNHLNNKLSTSRLVREIKSKNNCWICEGWREVKFTYKPKANKFNNNNNSSAYNNTTIQGSINIDPHSKQQTIVNNENYINTLNNNTQENFDNNNNNIDDKQGSTLNNLETMRYGVTGGSGFNISRSSAEVKMYLSQNNFKNFDAEKNIDTYYAFRMCKPGMLRYYYTVNGEPISDYGNNTTKLNEALIAEYENNKEFEDDETLKKQYIVSKVGEMQVEPFENLLSENYVSKVKYCVPRPEKKLKTKMRPRTPWRYEDSIWAFNDYKYSGFNEETLREAFEFDYERAKISSDKDIKSPTEEQEIKDLLWKYYSQILDIYKYYSSNTGMTIFQISQNSILDFANNCEGLCDKQYGVNFMFLKEAEVKNLDKEERKNKNKLVPDNMIRHQFLAFLVKIAKDKYIQKISKFNNLFDAVEYTFNNHYIHCFGNQYHHKWRIERYYNEHVDNFIKAFYPVLDVLFRSFARREIGKRDFWMNLEDFTNFSNSMVDKEFPTKLIPTIFCVSNRLEVNEVNSERHLQIFFEEFLEGMSRVIDKLSPIPDGEAVEDWPLQARQDQHLSIKLLNAYPLILNNIKDEFKNIKEKFTIPSKDEYGLYTFDIASGFYLNIFPKNLHK